MPSQKTAAAAVQNNDQTQCKKWVHNSKTLVNFSKQKWHISRGLEHCGLLRTVMNNAHWSEFSMCSSIFQDTLVDWAALTTSNYPVPVQTKNGRASVE